MFLYCLLVLYDYWFSHSYAAWADGADDGRNRDGEESDGGRNRDDKTNGPNGDETRNRDDENDDDQT